MTIPHAIYSYSYTTGSSGVHSNNSIPLAVVSSHNETSQITTGILIQSIVLMCLLTLLSGSSHTSELTVPITPTQHELLDSTVPLPNIQSMTSSTSLHHATTSVEDTERDEREQVPSRKNILTRHLSDITDVVLDPEKLANDLHSAGLITFHIKDRVLTTSSYPRYEKVSMLLNDVRRLLRDDSDREKLMIFCDVLKIQNNETLTGITQDMLRELG